MDIEHSQPSHAKDASSDPHKTLILGMGASGRSVADYLSAQGEAFSLVDTRLKPHNLKEFQAAFPEAPCWLGPLDADLLASAERLIVSPGIPIQDPAIEYASAHGVEILGDIEIFCRAAKAPIIAITGSNAKSTVTSLVGAMAQAAGLNVGIGGNLGPTALSLLDEARDAYILELSSFQLETTFSLHARAASILNVSEDHMDRYADLIEYVFAKQRIYHHCQTAIINRGDKYSAPLHAHRAQHISFGLDLPEGQNYGLHHEATGTWLMRGREALIHTQDLSPALLGQHGALNALAALALAETLALPLATSLEVLTHFQGLDHRCQLVTEHQGVRWINDSKATNVGATLAAIEGIAPECKGRLWLILGGDGKQADFSPLIASISRHVHACALLGRDAPLFADLLTAAEVTHQSYTDLDAIVQDLAAKVQPNDWVLLSPACASLDMFAHFGERGRLFSEAVRTWVCPS
ncbi:UDP-N-acetylmuramoylalanine--D-glutamate ligase [Allopseudospirillum japonicum]|uniref:UDP-N-acetylmuramoylalanine--D-glutamate ligase n=1 Tax=Allopseudospirillum japonicum TaxID=64971 RepID=A0A1H6QJ28_9GAMM|nr:UDP-N-acetylmuramoyl-L-alanine--D-glutamate ligase [Allopseudospirillum japonicum]SEI40187.1 UDP-N-acetylmuramoylalanine--D-glutamate ligase [Allopseudospirillum japonicum]